MERHTDCFDHVEVFNQIFLTFEELKYGLQEERVRLRREERELAEGQTS